MGAMLVIMLVIAFLRSDIDMSLTRSVTSLPSRVSDQHVLGLHLSRVSFS